MLLGKKKQKDKSNSLLICISPHCLNPVLTQTTKLRLSDYTGMLGYYTGQEQPDILEFLFALSNLLNIQRVKKLTLSHFCRSRLLHRYEHKPTSQSTRRAVSCYQAQPLTHCWGQRSWHKLQSTAVSLPTLIFCPVSRSLKTKRASSIPTQVKNSSTNAKCTKTLHYILLPDRKETVFAINANTSKVISPLSNLLALLKIQTPTFYKFIRDGNKVFLQIYLILFL